MDPSMKSPLNFTKSVSRMSFDWARASSKDSAFMVTDAISTRRAVISNCLSLVAIIFLLLVLLDRLDSFLKGYRRFFDYLGAGVDCLRGNSLLVDPAVEERVPVLLKAVHVLENQLRRLPVNFAARLECRSDFDLGKVGHNAHSH